MQCQSAHNYSNYRSYKIKYKNLYKYTHVYYNINNA